MNWLLELSQFSVFSLRLKCREDEPKRSSVLLCTEEKEYLGSKAAGTERAMHLRGQNCRTELRGLQKVPPSLQLSTDQSISVRKLSKARERATGQK